MSRPTEVLGPSQQRALRSLAPVVTPLGWYLAGGTALALQLSHRRSVDLDWFLAGEFPDPKALVQQLQRQGLTFATGMEGQGTLDGKVLGVQVTFLEYQYPLLEPLVPYPSGALLAGCQDLAAMKLSAVAQRGAKKDFVDLHALMAAGFSLTRMVECYQRKFAVSDMAHLLNSLVYFKDADPQKMPRMLRKTTWREVKSALRTSVRELAGPEGQSE